MRRKKILQCSATLLASLLLAGCGSNNIVPVSGQVTLDGTPLSGVSLTFVPTAESGLGVGPGSMAKTDAEGKFTLQTVKGQTGAVIAVHIVRISPSMGESTPDLPGEETQVKLPRQADDGSLRFKVPLGGTEQANFELISDSKRRR